MGDGHALMQFIIQPDLIDGRWLIFLRALRFLGIGLAHCNPNIHISGRTGIPMVPYRITANEQIFNAVRVQKSQEIFEVWM